jgi:DNA-binding MarR family transcriptional regulator
MGVVDDTVDDTELERLLMQLVRVVTPAPVGEPPVHSPAELPPVVTANSGPGQSGTRHSPDGLSPDAPGPRLPVGETLPGDPGANPGAAGRGGDAGIPVVSASEARALFELISARGIAQGELAGLLGLEKSTVSRLAAGLERKGWIRRGRDGDNQRYVRLYLTPEGRGVAAQVWGAWQSRQARILGSLSPEERAGLSAGLRGLVRGLAAEGVLGETPPPGGGS